jgi:hypothetical protein
MPRKTIKTTELIQEIVRLIISGETISSICEKPGMPDRRTVHRWLSSDEKFHNAYKGAALVRSHELIAETLEIADRTKMTHVEVAADRLRISARIKMAGVLNSRLLTGGIKQNRLAEKADKVGKVEVQIINSEEELQKLEAIEKGKSSFDSAE